MRLNNLKYINRVVFFIVGLIIALSFESCNTKDEMAPVITLIGEDSIRSQPLNQVYVDEGATAMDETDGDISENIFVESLVNVDILGWYEVIYNVVDKAGNSAKPVSRPVRVINQGYLHDGDFMAYESMVYPEKDTCSYHTYFDLDSTVNLRMIFTNFACEENLNIYADMNGALLEIPLQFIVDSTRNMSIQGAGYINDSLIYLEYLKTTDTLSSTWNSTFIRLSGF